MLRALALTCVASACGRASVETVDALHSAADSSPTGTTDSSLTDGALPQMVLPSYLVGYNEGWFGDHYSSDLTSNFDTAYIDKTLDGIVAAHGHVMRLWLLEGAQGIVWNIAGTPPRTQGVETTFLAHVDYVMTAARRRGLWVYVTALNASEAYVDPPPLMTYFHDMFNNVNGELDAYDQQVLGPVLDVVAAHDNLYALDLANEIEAAIQHDVFPDRWNAPRAFMKHMRDYVRTRVPNLRVTVSAGIGNPTPDIALGLFSGIGLDFYDLHEYSDSGQYSGATSVCDRAAQDGVFAILGEFGQSSHAIDDNVQLVSTTEFLANSHALCFKAALGWRYDYSALSTSNWFNYVRADGTLRPAAAAFASY